MTEAEWLACEDPEPMAKAAVECPRTSDRICRLYLAAFWGWQALRLTAKQQPALLKRVAATEHWAETGKLPKRFRVSDSTNVVFFSPNPRPAVTRTAHALSSWGKSGREAIAIQPALLRDIFGNPFRPVALDPAWVTSDVLALARGIYEERAFDRMPILADALQDAGCTNEDVLNHCRDANATHVRGCWVVDLLLGKS
jgi:hypothetical protein